ncbi:MAG: hypothetical protein H6700_03730 [Myxococcales bacterium]|nr:hypothetical protein [Myxococcales bacterium]
MTAPQGDPISVLWRDETAIAVDKPSGVLVHNSAFAGPREISLRQQLGAQTGRRVFPVHRVDRGTSGVLLFATETEHVAAWQSTLASPHSAKLYLTVVRGRVADDDATIATPLRDEHRTLAAQTHFIRLAVSPVARCSLLAVVIATGRHHQIRRHLNGVDHPVVNDATHGNSRFNREIAPWTGTTRMLLHAWALRLTPPRTCDAIELVAAPTGDLAAALDRLFPELDLLALRDHALYSAAQWRAARAAEIEPEGE